MKTIFITLAIFMVTTPVFAQLTSEEEFLRDSAAIAKVKLVRPQFRFDNRVTYSEGQALSIKGFDAGVLLSEKLRITLGYYSMEDQLRKYNTVIESEEHSRLIELKYGALNTEFIYYDTRFLSLGTPLELGIGVNKFIHRNLTVEESYLTESGLVAFVNFGLTATFKPLRFVGLKGMVGYRKVAWNEVKGYNLDGPFTGIGLNIDLHALTSDFKMYRLKKRHQRGNNLQNAVEIITD
jgi:hypothetical protein